MLSEDQKIKIEHETKLLVELFLETNASDRELSVMTEIPSSTIGRRLIDHERIVSVFDHDINKLANYPAPEEYKNYYGEYIYNLVKERRKANLQFAKSKGGISSIQKNSYLKMPDGKFVFLEKIDLSDVYKDEKNQMRFLGLCALTFRLHLETLSSLTDIDPNLLFNMLISYNSDNRGGLKFLFYEDCTNQEQAKRDFKTYYLALLDAVKKRDKEKIHNCLLVIKDLDIINFRNNRQKGDKLSNEDIALILKFQVKYGYSSMQIANFLDIDAHNYARRVRKYVADKPELSNNFETLTEVRLHGFFEGGRY